LKASTAVEENTLFLCGVVRWEWSGRGEGGRLGMQLARLCRTALPYAVKNAAALVSGEGKLFVVDLHTGMA
jgi:hypothetical protein